MKIVYLLAGIAGLLLLLVPAIMHFRGTMDPDQMKNLMLIGTLLWFAGAIPLLGKKQADNV